MPASSPRGTNEGSETHDPRTSAILKLLVNATHGSDVEYALGKFEFQVRKALGDAAYLEAEDSLWAVFNPPHKLTAEEEKEVRRVLDAAYAAVDYAETPVQDPRRVAMWNRLVNQSPQGLQHGLEQFERETRKALGDAAYLETEDALQRIFAPAHEATMDDVEEARRVLDAAYAAVDRAAVTTRDTSAGDVAAMLS
jgi:hypothetical protein